jgi:hypothetical protein
LNWEDDCRLHELLSLIGQQYNVILLLNVDVKSTLLLSIYSHAANGHDKIQGSAVRESKLSVYLQGGKVS